MTAAYALALALVGGHPPDPDAFPLALHRGMELDDQDREIRRQHDLVLARRGPLADTLRLAEKGLVSRDAARREQTDVRYQEALEAEMIAYRAFKTYERDVLGGSVEHDETRSYSLLLDLLGKQEAMARVELEYRAYRLGQEQALIGRGATSRYQRDAAQDDYEAARGRLAISVARQAQVAMELAARAGVRPYDAEEFYRRKAAYLRARVGYSEVRVAGLRRRLELAVQGHRAGITAESEVAALRQMLADAEEDLRGERGLQEDLEAPLPPRLTRFT